MHPDATIEETLRADKWTVVSGHVENEPYTLRYRTPVPALGDTGTFRTRLRCLWPFAPEDSGELPDSLTLASLEAFENDLCHAWEAGNNAILVAVLTFDGARQWVFYTKSVEVCGERLNAMPQQREPYPIELDAEEDADWSYLREQIIRDRGMRA